MGDPEEGNPSVRLCEINYNDGSCGFNVTKNKWDPYPWVSTVEEGSPAFAAGVQPGDCLLEINGDDMLGLRVAQVAQRIKARGGQATVMLWTPGVDADCNSESLCCGPMPTNLKRLGTCMNGIVEALECPVCLDTTPPPAHQCVNGHIICLKCRTQTDRCPVCRVRLFRGRSLLADQIFDTMVDAFDLRRVDETARGRLIVEKVCGPKRKNKKKPEIKINLMSPTNKFLSKLMGSRKSSSVENLSKVEEMGSAAGLKAKSLSSSEINKMGPVPGSTLSLSSRPGSGLLDISGSRPVSYHGSTEDLRSRLIADFDVDLSTSETLTRCPLAPSCDARIPQTSLKRHIDQHNAPVLHYNRPEIEILPSWLAETLIVLQCFGTLFFVRSPESNNLSVWTVYDSNKVQFTACVKCNDQVFHCGVIPLVDLSSTAINHCQIPISASNDKLTLSIIESRGHVK